MATNVVLTNAYQLNQHPISLGTNTAVGIPTAGIFIQSCIDSPTRALSTGVNVYSLAILPNGDKYYFTQTVSQLATLLNA